MERRFEPGEEIALREVWRGDLWTARPARVIEHTARRTILHVEPGSRWWMPIDPESGDQLRYPEREWILAERTWTTNRVLSFAWPGVSHAVLLFWRLDPTSTAPAWRFAGWYVNLQTPLARSPVGFDYMDDMLDLVVDPDRTWRWKDAEELRRCEELGLWTPERATAVRIEGERALAALRRRDEPFDERWTGWTPGPDLPTPVLPPEWRDAPSAPLTRFRA